MNGWANHATWNVTLWIANDERLYNLAGRLDSYDEFVRVMRDLAAPDDIAYQTPDGVAWDDPSIDRDQVNEFWVDSFSQEA